MSQDLDIFMNDNDAIRMDRDKCLGMIEGALETVRHYEMDFWNTDFLLSLRGVLNSGWTLTESQAQGLQNVCSGIDRAAEAMDRNDDIMNMMCGSDFFGE